MHVLQHGRQALQAHAGVDARCRQRRERAVRGPVELHEHEVPYLDIAIAILVGRTRGTAGDIGTVVVEDLGAGPARTGVGHLPEVVRRKGRALVVADADDAVRRHADFLVPDVVGLVVGVIDGDPQPFGRKLVNRGEQFPRVADGIALEVVAERPVAEHLEEGVMPGGIAHGIEIVVLAAGTQATLDVGRPDVARLFTAEEHILERDHARVGEQQRRVVRRHQRCRRHDGVVLGAEEVEEGRTDLGGFHERSWRGSCETCRGDAPSRIKAHCLQSSSASSASAWVRTRTVAAAKPRRKRNCALRARSAGSADGLP